MLIETYRGRLTIRSLVRHVSSAANAAGRSRILARDVTTVIPYMLHTAECVR
jgi:hypothetical protein